MLTIFTVSIQGMEVPRSDTEKALWDIEEKHSAFSQTQEFKNYEAAKKLHEKYNTPETFALMEQAASYVLETEESKAFLETVEKKQTEAHATQTFSDYVLEKHIAMSKTPEFIQYEKAKIAHQECNTADTLHIVNLCKSELHNTQECQDWLRTTELELAEKLKKDEASAWAATSQTPEYLLSQNAKKAWVAVSQTPEYLLFQNAKKAHKIHNNADTKYLLDIHQRNAKETVQYKQYFNILEQKRKLLEKINVPSSPHIAKRIIDLPSYSICFNNTDQAEIMESLKLTHITIIKKTS